MAVGETELQVGLELFRLFSEARDDLPETERNAFWNTYIEDLDEVPQGPDVIQYVDI